MAAGSSRRANGQRRSSITYRTTYYYDGNAVRVEQPEEIPVRRRKTSSRTRKNRARATSMGMGFVAFLAVVSVATLFMCVYYIQLKTEITSQNALIASRQTELADLKADNDALENYVSASMDLNAIQEKATNELGMHYPTEDQIVQYSTDGSGYVRQYNDISPADE